MNDEQAIRELMAEWQRATAASEVATILGLMSEDVVFLQAGQPPMRGREAFATAFKMVLQHVRIASTADIQEIVIAGEMAWCWNHLTVTITPLSGAAAMRRVGYTLTILRKQAAGNWVIVRDANLLTAATP